jgi:hypothetical protein
MKKARSLAQALTDPRVESYSDERNGLPDGGDGIWLYLRRPWWCPDSDLSVVHEWNVRDLLSSLNSCYEAPERWNSEYGI